MATTILTLETQSTNEKRYSVKISSLKPFSTTELRRFSVQCGNFVRFYVRRMSPQTVSERFPDRFHREQKNRFREEPDVSLHLLFCLFLFLLLLAPLKDFVQHIVNPLRFFSTQWP